MSRKKRTRDWAKVLARQTVEGKYRLLEFVGSGKIGFVYRSERVDVPGIEVAVKLMFGDPKDGWETEIRKVAALNLLESVVHFHDLGTDQIRTGEKTRVCQYTVWDYIAPGENLKTYLRRVGTVPASFIVAVVKRVLHVLDACQDKGIVRHGDLHAGNILVGDSSASTRDDNLEKRVPIFVSDFGYGATEGEKTPKDDFNGLAIIINLLLQHFNYATASASDRQLIRDVQSDLGKLLKERRASERQLPINLLRVLTEICRNARAHHTRESGSNGTTAANAGVAPGGTKLGQFQVSEMIGERWDWWKKLFVPSVPARSKIMDLNIPTVVTGPRGCGKTMLFRRLSERLVVECGPVDDATARDLVAFFVNANDFADAFSRFPESPTARQEQNLVCFANLCVLSDVLSVLSARAARNAENPPEAFVDFVKSILISSDSKELVQGEDRLERYRAALEEIKWSFLGADFNSVFPGYTKLSQTRWLPHFVAELRVHCAWAADRSVLLLVDDFSTPRVSASMQRVLNRLFLQRSSHFLAKLATEAWSTFVPEDSSGKALEDGEDYQLIDIGEESLFLTDRDRLMFLNKVFSKRLSLDIRLQELVPDLASLLGRLDMSKTEFARKLRETPLSDVSQEAVPRESQRRGQTRARVLYFGENVFADLWSGDTRTMIQLLTDVVNQAFPVGDAFVGPVSAEIQDRAFRNRGGEWLNSHTRNEPTSPSVVRDKIRAVTKTSPGYSLTGTYGDHLKAVVEAFAAAAKALLFGPTYTMKETSGEREVPRMAFRLEIIDEFRIDGLALEIYRDLIRYGLFMRDNRGKSVRGNFVPRLYLRRLLLPYCALPLSKRDSVQIGHRAFELLLLEPDQFRQRYSSRRQNVDSLTPQLPFGGEAFTEHSDAAYDDLSQEDDV